MGKSQSASVKRYIPDCSIHMSHEIAFMRETTKGQYVEYLDYQQLAAVKKIAEARIVILEREHQALIALNQALSDKLSDALRGRHD